MRYRDLTKRLTQMGCELDRQGKGSHQIWVNPQTHQKAVISDYGGKDIPPGTIRAIIRQLGIDRNEFGPIK